MLTRLYRLSLILILSQLNLGAQNMPQGASSGMNALMMRMFGEEPFTATAHSKMTGKDTGLVEFSMPVSSMGDRFRAEIDVSKMKSESLPPDQLVAVKAMGMDKMVSIINSVKKTTTLVYPGLKVSVEMPIPKEEADAFSKDYKISKTSLGTETVDGRATEKEKYVFGEAPAKQQEMLVWRAKELKGFPVKIQMVEDKTTVEMTYKDVKFTKPDSKTFEIPEGYQKFSNMAQLQQVIMKRMMETVK